MIKSLLLIFTAPLCLLFFPLKAYGYDFACSEIRGVPTTVVHTQRGIIPVIYWVLDLGNATPQERCAQVSRNFQAAQDNDQLRYISSGYINGQQVICTATEKNGECVDLLFTVRPGSNVKEILLQICDLRGLASGEAIEQGDDQRIYINFEKYLERIPPLVD